MSKNQSSELFSDVSFIETPRGIFTKSGIQFHTTRTELESFGKGVFEYVSLESLINYSETWLRSPQILALWILALTLLFIPFPIIDVILTLGVFFLWAILSPGLVNLSLFKVFSILDNTLLQIILYLVVLSFLAVVWEAAEAVVFGLAGFILLRWQIIPKIFQYITDPLLKKMYKLPIPDQVLRGFIYRYALKYHLPIGAIKDMETDLLKNLQKKKYL